MSRLDVNGDGKVDWRDLRDLLGIGAAAREAGELAEREPGGTLSESECKSVLPVREYAETQCAKEWTDLTGAQLPDATPGEREALLQALEKLKGSDRVGVLAELLTLSGSAAAGAAASGTLAAAAGVTTATTGTWLAGLFGMTVVAATPIGWIVGCGLAGGAVGFLLSRMLRSGGKNDAIRRRVEDAIREQLRRLNAPKEGDQMRERFLAFVQGAVEQELMHPAAAARLVAAVDSGAFDLATAFARAAAAVESRRAANAAR